MRLFTALTFTLINFVFSLDVLASNGQLIDTQKKLNVVERALRYAITPKLGALKLKQPNIKGIYLPGQGMAFTIGKIGLEDVLYRLDIESSSASNDVKIAIGENTTNQTVNHSTNNELRKKSKDLAHEAHHLREQMRSLSKQLKTADSKQRQRINEHQHDVREEIKTVEMHREKNKVMASKVSITPQFGGSPFTQESFYHSLANDILLAVCQESKIAPTLKKNESLSFILVDGGRIVDKQSSTKVIMIKNNDIIDCSQNKLTSRDLLNVAAIYHY